MNTLSNFSTTASQSLPHQSDGADIIRMAEDVGLDPRLLYQAVIDLSREGLLTANCINFAAGILLKDLGLPAYFFENISPQVLSHLLQSIALNIRVKDGRANLFGRVAHIDFDLSYSEGGQRVRIATEETRDSMENMLEELTVGRRRDYYFSPENGYHTYIIRSEIVDDFPSESFSDNPFLYSLVGSYSDMPEPTRKRYENFLLQSSKSPVPLILAYNLPDIGETRLMFNSDFEDPQLPVLRKILSDRGYTLVRAYWEPYFAETGVTSSICSLYIRGELTRKAEQDILQDLRDFIGFAQSSITQLYLTEQLSFKEMLFGGNCIDFAHLFIFKESDNVSDKEIMAHLVDQNHRDAFAKRLQDSNKSTYSYSIIKQTVFNNADLIKDLYKIFQSRFDPAAAHLPSDENLENQWLSFQKIIRSRFIDFPLGYDIFAFMFKFVSCTLKTNFYCSEKRSFSFRFDNRILDPLVFTGYVYGIFFVNGHYSCGTHMRSNDIARGGLRLLRITETNHDAELDGAVLLNYALGPKAQRIKHKDICESGSKGVVIPHPAYSSCSQDVLMDYTEGIMDLILKDDHVVDYYNQPEMVFFGPDEGTAQLMDHIALRFKNRGYTHWRTLTTGKSFGIPHDTYGLLENGTCFGLFDRGKEGVELQIEGETQILSNNIEDIHTFIGDSVLISGMTTCSVMSSFRTLIKHYGFEEEKLNLMITGGPDGDLGANQIQCYKGKICLVIDGGSILFDPEGLDKKELRKLAFQRNSTPRKNSLDYPEEKLSAKGFRVPLKAKDISLPDGTIIRDGALFHRTFLTESSNRRFIEAAKIEAFIPCGGFKDTINHANIKNFLHNFRELKCIVEGANVFFDDSARRYIANETSILQIKDSSANKGGVFSSSIAEVLTAFLLSDQYETELEGDRATKWGLIKDIMHSVKHYAEQETTLLITLHELNDSKPLFDLSEQTSEAIFSFQEQLEEYVQDITANDKLVSFLLHSYIPQVLIQKLGMERIMRILKEENLVPYLQAILTKKMASLAYYTSAKDWQSLLEEFESDHLLFINGFEKRMRKL